MLIERSECPGIEEIGALIDGRVSGSKKADLLRHLDECPDCYEIFTATVAFQAENPGREERAPATASSHWLWEHRTWLATAAVILFVLVLFWPSSDLRLEPARQMAKELSLGIDPLALVARVRAGGVVSTRFASGVTESAAALRTGQALVDLHVLIEAGDRESAESLAKDLLTRVKERAGWGGLAVILERLVAGGAGSGSDFARGHEAELDALEEQARASLDPFYLELGKWAESCRIAAAVGSSQFLNRPATGAFVRQAVSRQTPPPVRNELRALEKLWREKISGESSLREIEERTGDLFALMT